ncbi:unnamed protein product [Merluccius merluccius]
MAGLWKMAPRLRSASSRGNNRLWVASAMSLVDLGKRLLEAARKGQDDEVRILMANGAPFTTDWLGTSPLHLAAQHGHYSTAEVLLRAGVSRDARTKVDRTPLHMAASKGHTVIVELLVRSGADINARDMLKMTALHWAAQHGHQGVVQTLLKHGADVHALSKFDKTPFDIAVDIQHTDLMLLLQEGMQSQLNSSSQPQFIIQGLSGLQGGVVNLADLLNKASTGETEEAIAASVLDSNIQHAVVNEGGQRVITIVTDQHGNLQTSGGMGQPFFVTMQHGQQMLAMPANTVTEEVVEEEEEEEELQPPPSRKRKIEATNHNDSGDTELLQRQLQEATRKAQEYRTQLLRKEQEAEEYRVKLEAMSQSNGTSSPPEEVVGGEEEEEVVEGEVEEEGEMVSILMEGEDVTLVETTELGTSPLHLAAQHGHYSTAEVLLRAGVSRDARTKVDRTPLHMAASKGHTVIVELLVRSGADINARDMLKMTALHWAAQHGHQGVVQTLLKHGADVHALSKFDKTPFDIAVDIQHTDLMLLLQEGMQSQLNSSSQPQFIIQGLSGLQGGVVNLADLLNKASTGPSEHFSAGLEVSTCSLTSRPADRVVRIVCSGVWFLLLSSCSPHCGCSSYNRSIRLTVSFSCLEVSSSLSSSYCFFKPAQPRPDLICITWWLPALP